MTRDARPELVVGVCEHHQAAGAVLRGRPPPSDASSVAGVYPGPNAPKPRSLHRGIPPDHSGHMRARKEEER
jgi:hypothetical protein